MKNYEGMQERGGGRGLTLLLVLLTPVLGCGSGAPAEDTPAVSVPGATHEEGPRELVARALPGFLEAREQTVWPQPTARMARVRAALATGDGAAVEDLLALELAQHPDSPEAILVQSQLDYSRAKMLAARPGLERVLAGGPSFEGAGVVFYYYGGCLLRLGDGAGARAALDAHLELAPGAGETLYLLGELELQEGRSDAALARFQESLTAHAQAPAKTRARDEAGVARALFSRGEVEASHEALGRSLQLDPLEAQSHYQLARILTRLGDRRGARHATVDFKRCESGLDPRYYGHEDEAPDEAEELDE